MSETTCQVSLRPRALRRRRRYGTHRRRKMWEVVAFDPRVAGQHWREESRREQLLTRRLERMVERGQRLATE
jgi:hypothetical protein